MPLYDSATISLIRKLKTSVTDVNQVWYADDTSAAEKVNKLHQWWDVINMEVPRCVYLPNACKTWLVSKEDCVSSAAAALLIQK